MSSRSTKSEDIGRDSPTRVLAESEHLNGDSGCCDVLERFAEGLTVGGRDHDSRRGPRRCRVARCASSMSASTSVSSSTWAWRKRRNPRYAMLRPTAGPHRRCPGAILVKTVASGSSVAAARCGEFRGAGEQPAAQCVESWPVGGGGAAAEDGAETHVEVGGVPDQQDPLGVARLTDRRRVRRGPTTSSSGSCPTDAHASDLPPDELGDRSCRPDVPCPRTWSPDARGSSDDSRSSAVKPRLGVARPRRSTRRNRRGRWPRAELRRGFRRSAISANVGPCSSRRLWCRALGQGSGKKTRTPAKDSWRSCSRARRRRRRAAGGRCRCSSRSICCRVCASRVCRPRSADQVEVRFGLGHRGGRGAGTRSDLDDQRCRCGRTRRRRRAVRRRRRGRCAATDGPRCAAGRGQRPAARAETRHPGIQPEPRSWVRAALSSVSTEVS